MEKKLEVGVRIGGGPPPGYLWNVVILKVARKESLKFLDEAQYYYVAEQIKELAREGDPSHSETQSVDDLGEFLELRDKGGPLGRINVRVFFFLDKEKSPGSIVILGAIKKENDGPTPGAVKICMRRRKRLYLSGELGEPQVQGAGVGCEAEEQAMETTEVLQRHGVEEASLIMAVAIVKDRVSRLSEQDREDLYELAKELVLARDKEALEHVFAAMLEILEQAPVGQAAQMVLGEPTERPEKLEKWVGWISAKIKELRTRADMTQEELAKKSGLPQSHISRLENGQHSPSHATVEKLAAALNVPVSELDPTS